MFLTILLAELWVFHQQSIATGKIENLAMEILSYAIDATVKRA